MKQSSFYQFLLIITTFVINTALYAQAPDLRIIPLNDPDTVCGSKTTKFRFRVENISQVTAYNVNITANFYNVPSVNIMGMATSHSGSFPPGFYRDFEFSSPYFNTANGASIRSVANISGGTDQNRMNDTTKNIYVFRPLPVVNAGSDQEICKGDSVMLSAASSNVQYLWNTGDSTQSVRIAPDTTTLYTVVVTDRYSCSASDDLIIKVNELPQVSLQSDSICFGDTVSLMIPATYSAVWSDGSTNNNLLVFPEQTEIYWVEVTDSSGCTNRDTATIRVDPLPQPQILSATHQICLNKEYILLDAFPAGGIFSGPGVLADTLWVELFKDSLNSDSIVNIIYQYTDHKGCTAEDSFNYYAELCTGISDEQEPEMNVYPNPFADWITIDMVEKADEIRLIGIDGKVIKHVKEISDRSLTLDDLQHLSPSIYILEVTSNGNCKRIKILKD